MPKKNARTKTSVAAKIIFGALLFGPLVARAEMASDSPWEKLSVSVGGYISNTDSSIRLGAGLGVDLDVEETLDMDVNNTVFRAQSGWRFSDNRKHRVDLSWFALHRQATRTIGRDFEITRPNGSTTTIAAGSEVTSHFDLDIYEVTYSYSFLQDNRVDLAVLTGLYVMPIDFGLTSSGAAEAEGSLKFAAPLPVVGYRMDFALTPKWFFRSQSQFFYVAYKNFQGRLSELRGAIEYVPFKNVGVGMGFDTLHSSFEADGKDFPSVDMSGKVQFQNNGLQLYAKYFF
jgi:hypothetical protein